MDEQTNQQHQPVAVQGTHVVQATPQAIAAIFGKPVVPAEELRKRSESQLAAFYDMLLNSPDHLQGVVKRLTTAQMDKLPDSNNIAGRKRHPIVVEMVKTQGYEVTTAEKLLSNMIRMREAYQSAKYVPEAGTPWNDAYDAAVKALGSAVKQRKAQTAKADQDALQDAIIGAELRKLPEDQRKNPVAIAEAMERAQAIYDQRQKQGKVVTAGIAAIQAIGGEAKIPDLIEYLQQRYDSWHSEQSAKTVAPMEVPTSEEVQAKQSAPEPNRQAA